MLPEGTISVTYRREKCLKELITPSLCELTCFATGKTYKVKGDLTCKSDNVVYLISFKKCKEQYVGSAFERNFKPRFRVHEIDISTGKDRCGVAKNFLNNCTGINKLENVEVQLIEKVKECNYNIEGKLWSSPVIYSYTRYE